MSALSTFGGRRTSAAAMVMIALSLCMACCTLPGPAVAESWWKHLPLIGSGGDDTEGLPRLRVDAVAAIVGGAPVTKGQVLVVDVRTVEELKETGHMVGAINVGYEDASIWFQSLVKKNTAPSAVLYYCKGGTRANIAATSTKNGLGNLSTHYDIMSFDGTFAEFTQRYPSLVTGAP